jgi:hypothetical protein
MLVGLTYIFYQNKNGTGQKPGGEGKNLTTPSVLKELSKAIGNK